ncbi:hypothetical protein D1AOALGA4SA_12109 [Olavius algarvensis Delta 1 endosymbiont]|nr:hypothetical protein D1AOALGA4SA_12109 [Olavius algarvensis Delta 1 endosymbiont]
MPLGIHIQGQLIRCSTSVAANYRAACHAQSKASFISKEPAHKLKIDQNKLQNCRSNILNLVNVL